MTHSGFASWNVISAEKARSSSSRISSGEDSTPCGPKIAPIYAELIKITTITGNCDQAAEFVREAEHFFRALARNNAYRPTAEAADKFNACGKQRLSITGGERRKPVQKRRDWFHAAADCVSDKFWYCLNLAYAYAELGDYAEAVDSRKAAMENGSAWSDSKVLRNRLQEWAN
jgi:tetratricopeptide (TPR) repeat protein